MSTTEIKNPKKTKKPKKEIEEMEEKSEEEFEIDPDLASMLELDQSLFDEYLIRNIKMRQSTPYYISFDCGTGEVDSYETALKNLKEGITSEQYVNYYDNVITNDQCVIEYDFPLSKTYDS